MRNLPVIAGIEIGTDAEGRFNLNLLHKASELGANKAPAQWLRTQQTKELITEVEQETMQICTVSVEGRNGGTFAHELLAISYAGWISPAFQIKVNQVFIDFRKGLLQAALPQTYVSALRALADKTEEAERAAEAERLAIATKAEIGSRREATAMATASAQKRRADRLELEMGESKKYASVKRMERLYGRKFGWRPLKAACKEMDLPPIPVDDANYGAVNSYHADVWLEAYAVSIEDAEAA